jgi:serine/threonine protein phosphatase PrpC
MGCGSSSPAAAAQPARPRVTFAVDSGGSDSPDFSVDKLQAEDDELCDEEEYHDPTQRYQGRPHATSLSFKPFRVDVSLASIAANSPCEDRTDVRESVAGSGVARFDGHGGVHASEFCQEHTLALFDDARERGKDVAEALAECVAASEAQFLQRCRSATSSRRAMLTGTCALIVHVDKLARAINVANVGDSRAVLAERDEFGILSAVPLSFDHSAQSDFERHRLSVQFPGEDRIVRERFDSFAGDYNRTVHGLTMFTRSIGDFELKHGFAAEFFNSLVGEDKKLPMPDEEKPWISHEPRAYIVYLGTILSLAHVRSLLPCHRCVVRFVLFPYRSAPPRTALLITC